MTRLAARPHRIPYEGPPPNEAGRETTITIEIGPLVFSGPSAEARRRWAKDLQRDLDQLVREHLAVGPYSKVVHARTEEAKR